MVAARTAFCHSARPAVTGRLPRANAASKELNYGYFSIWLILLVVVLVLFGGSNKISNMMGDAEASKASSAAWDDGSKPADSTVRTIDHDAEAPLKTEAKREAQG